MKQVVMMALAACLVCGCEKAVFTEDDGNDPSEIGGGKNQVKNFTFTLKGDFRSEWKPVTRGYLSADDREMTDVWVLDYMDGVLVQQVHQTAGDADWGNPKMSLAYGLHHVYFVVSRGMSPVLNTGEYSIVWEKVGDTFWKDYEVDVVSTSNGNRAVTLDRVVTKLKLTVTDEVPEACSVIRVNTAKWYDGLDYMHGTPIESGLTERTVNVPESYAGTKGLLAVTLFGLSTTDEWVTDVSASAMTAGGGILGTAAMKDVPFKSNRQTEYSGPLFTSGGDMYLQLNAEWDVSVTGRW